MLRRSKAHSDELEKSLSDLEQELHELVEERKQYKKTLQDLNEK